MGRCDAPSDDIVSYYYRERLTLSMGGDRHREEKKEKGVWEIEHDKRGEDRV